MDERPGLEEADFSWEELIGLKVYTVRAGEGVDVEGGPSNAGDTDKGLLLGTVNQMMETGANDVMVVKKCHGSVDDQERLIPWLPEQVVKHVDLEAGLITVDWPVDF